MRTRAVRLYLLALLAALLHAAPARALSYSYDSLDRLTQVVYDDGTIISYGYDDAGNRLIRVVSVDPDGDGIRFAGGASPCAGGQSAGCEDNCPAAPNATQADLDADALGNACDEDDDADGLLDSHETGTGIFVSPTDTGTDPLNSDTDGDGVDDGAEVIAGTDPNQVTPVPTLGWPGLALLGLTLLSIGRLGLRGRKRGSR